MLIVTYRRIPVGPEPTNNRAFRCAEPSPAEITRNQNPEQQSFSDWDERNRHPPVPVAAAQLASARLTGLPATS